MFDIPLYMTAELTEEAGCSGKLQNHYQAIYDRIV